MQTRLGLETFSDKNFLIETSTNIHTAGKKIIYLEKVNLKYFVVDAL